MENMAIEIKQGKSEKRVELSPQQRSEMDHIAFYKQI
jgi:hypothetical protein